MCATQTISAEDGRGRLALVIRRAMALVASAMLIATAVIPPAAADHGSWHRHQHAFDYSSSVQVTPHSQCGTTCLSLFADVHYNGSWVEFSCYQVQSCLGNTRTFVFPVTVNTRHSYMSRDFTHSVLNEIVSIYYA